MKDLEIEGVELIGLAKERKEEHPGNDNPGKGEDRVFLPGRKDPVYLSRWPAALKLLQRIRDEAHRFAITYHRKLRQKGELQSLLDKIPGIGPVRKKALLVSFGDLKKIREASIADLMHVEGIGEETARQIRAALDGAMALHEK
jgi:excinuclease ABC subunit C